MRCMKVVLPEPAMPMQMMAHGGCCAVEEEEEEEEAMVEGCEPMPVL